MQGLQLCEVDSFNMFCHCIYVKYICQVSMIYYTIIRMVNL